MSQAGSSCLWRAHRRRPARLIGHRTLSSWVDGLHCSPRGPSCSAVLAGFYTAVCSSAPLSCSPTELLCMPALQSFGSSVHPYTAVLWGPLHPCTATRRPSLHSTMTKHCSLRLSSAPLWYLGQGALVLRLRVVPKESLLVFWERSVQSWRREGIPSFVRFPGRPFLPRDASQAIMPRALYRGVAGVGSTPQYRQWRAERVFSQLGVLGSRPSAAGDARFLGALFCRLGRVCCRGRVAFSGRCSPRSISAGVLSLVWRCSPEGSSALLLQDSCFPAVFSIFR